MLEGSFGLGAWGRVVAREASWAVVIVDEVVSGRDFAGSGTL